MADVANEQSGYKRLILSSGVVSNDHSGTTPFYLTRSPWCSSSLPPATQRLAPWAFRDLFAVERRVDLPAIRLPDALANHALDRVDWYKSDSQGTDLRLFNSLGDMADRVISAEFEPGILDAYDGEDKLHHILAALDARGFWPYRMLVREVPRLPATVTGRGMAASAPTAPGWVEIAALNGACAASDRFDLRSLLLAWAMATTVGQHGFALEVATATRKRFGTPICVDMQAHSHGQLRRCRWLALPRLVSQRLRGMAVSRLRRMADTVSGRR
ncbi:MAG: hypothetical protein H0W72_07105 [Planctomycetes bacterium]|nr:hypothetical protein [Planctomycetota bacterium]